MAHTETMLESKEIFNGRVIRVTVDKVQLEDGTTSTREIVHHLSLIHISEPTRP